MSNKKLKCYVLIVSRYFPASHPRKGDSTGFVEKIQAGYKIHTIRNNTALWSLRMRQVQEGKAYISIRYWSSKPYQSKQVEICKLDKDSGIGMQEILFSSIGDWAKTKNERKKIDFSELVLNDGLFKEDFKDWFKDHNSSYSMAVIHFTNFRY